MFPRELHSCKSPCLGPCWLSLLGLFLLYHEFNTYSSPKDLKPHLPWGGLSRRTPTPTPPRCPFCVLRALSACFSAALATMHWNHWFGFCFSHWAVRSFRTMTVAEINQREQSVKRQGPGWSLQRVHKQARQSR